MSTIAEQIRAVQNAQREANEAFGLGHLDQESFLKQSAALTKAMRELKAREKQEATQQTPSEATPVDQPVADAAPSAEVAAVDEPATGTMTVPGDVESEMRNHAEATGDDALEVAKARIEELLAESEAFAAQAASAPSAEPSRLTPEIVGLAQYCLTAISGLVDNLPKLVDALDSDEAIPRKSLGDVRVALARIGVAIAGLSLRVD
jgi:hypothetical protein